MHRDCATSAGHAISVDGVELVVTADSWKPIGKNCEAIPMRAALIAIEQTRTSQHIGPCTNRPDDNTPLRLLAQPRENRSGKILFNGKTAHDNYEVVIGYICQCFVEVDGKAIAATLSRRSFTQQFPGVKVTSC